MLSRCEQEDETADKIAETRPAVTWMTLASAAVAQFITSLV